MFRDILNENEKANQEYKKKFQEAKKLLKEIDKSLDKFDEKQKKDSKNWEFHGSMGRVVEDLKETLEFIKA